MYYDPAPNVSVRFTGALECRAPYLARYLEVGDVITDQNGTDYMVVDTMSNLEMDTGALLVTHTVQEAEYE